MRRRNAQEIRSRIRIKSSSGMVDESLKAQVREREAIFGNSSSNAQNDAGGGCAVGAQKAWREPGGPRQRKDNSCVLAEVRHQ
jgi:hypothetical protein